MALTQGLAKGSPESLFEAITNRGYNAGLTVTRPANTTAYTAGDVVGAALAALTFPNMGGAGEMIKIVSAMLTIDLAAVPASMTTFRLHLYNVTPPSALADNAPWDLPSGDRASYLGYVDFGAPADIGSSLHVQADGLAHHCRLITTSLFGYLVTAGGYTPTSAEVLRPSLSAVLA